MNRFPLILTGVFSSLLLWNTEAMAESLKESVAKALPVHPETKAALSRLRAEETSIGSAAAAYWPTLDLSGGIGQKRTQANSSTSDTDSKDRLQEASLSFKQNLFNGFNTRNSVDSAKKGTLAEQWQFYSTLEGLALKITDAYLKVLESQDLLELAEENLALHNEIYDQIERRTNQGVARSSDLIQVEGRRARANANLINAKNNLVDAESTFRAQVGHNPENLEFPGFINLRMPADLASAIKEGLKNHPDMKAADLNIESSDLTYSSRKSSYLPSLDAEVDQTWDNKSAKTGDEGTRESTDTVAMLKISYNLFNGGGDKARLLESAYRAEESRSQRSQVMRDVEERMRIAWAAFEYTSGQREYLLVHEEASRKTVDAYREQYNIGKRTLLDLLDTENELFQSSNSLTSAVYQEVYARYRVLAAGGQLLQNIGFVIPDSWQVEDD